MGESDRTDAELVKLARAGGQPGQRAFDELVSRHQAWLVKFLYHLVGNQSDAEDVAQEALVRAFMAIDDCRKGEGFRSWLRVIARRLAFNHIRDSKTRQRYQDKAAPERDGDSALATHLVEREAITGVLTRLSYPFREVMILRYVEELSVKEIAGLLEIGESAAKMRLARARAEFSDGYERD